MDEGHIGAMRWDGNAWEEKRNELMILRFFGAYLDSRCMRVETMEFARDTAYCNTHIFISFDFCGLGKLT